MNEEKYDGVKTAARRKFCLCVLCYAIYNNKIGKGQAVTQEQNCTITIIAVYGLGMLVGKIMRLVLTMKAVIAWFGSIG